MGFGFNTSFIMMNQDQLRVNVYVHCLDKNDLQLVQRWCFQMQTLTSNGYLDLGDPTFKPSQSSGWQIMRKTQGSARHPGDLIDFC